MTNQTDFVRMISQRLPGYFRRKTVLDLTGQSREIFVDCVYNDIMGKIPYEAIYDVVIGMCSPIRVEIDQLKVGGLYMRATELDLSEIPGFEDEFPIGFHNDVYFWGIKTG